ncbi:metallophosphoesterase [Caulobacter sp.]|uniref:metallophosphoesterase family protein n=1 Tax=Caulobacter sp. TaxID=78 RepID=UPI0031DD763D
MRLALISDTHLAPVAAAFNANVEAAIDWIEAWAPDAVIHLGDVTADGAEDPAQFEHARRVLSRLSAPLHCLPGNHDVGDCPPAGGAKEPAFSPRRLAQFRGALGADQWWFARDGWTLIGLNSQLFASGDPEEGLQAEWLENELAAARGPVALFLHKPLALDHPDATPDHPRFAPPGPRRRLTHLLEGRQALVVSGHVHQHRRRRIVGADHLWAPSTAFLIPDSIQPRLGDKRVGLLTLELAPDGAWRAEMVTPRAMIPHDVLDHPEVYPQVADLPRSSM